MNQLITLIRKYKSGIAFAVLAIAVAFAINSSTNAAHQAQSLAQANKTNATNQLINRVANVYTWCGGINAGRDYDRGYFNGTLKQSQEQNAALGKAVNGDLHLTPAQHNFAVLYLGTLSALEKDEPAVINLHPYTLGDLNCKAIAKRTAKSPHTTVKQIEQQALAKK